MEQMIGTTPYRYEVVGESEARIVEHRRRGLFGQWGRPRIRIRWVRCRAVAVTEGTWVEVEASSGGVRHSGWGTWRPSVTRPSQVPATSVTNLTQPSPRLEDSRQELSSGQPTSARTLFSTA